MKTYSCKHSMEDDDTPGPCSWCEKNLLYTLKCLTNEKAAMKEALEGVRSYLHETLCASKTPQSDKLVIAKIDAALSCQKTEVEK